MIVAAAILYPNGEVVTAPRHYKIIHIQGQLGISSVGAVQGFVDHTGAFYTRQEAKVIALENKQIPEDHQGELYSEDLWGDGGEIEY